MNPFKTKNADKPAYPLPIASANGSIYNVMEQTGGEIGGLTKREHFAAMAMQGILSGGFYNLNPGIMIAKDAIRIADELLKQLES